MWSWNVIFKCSYLYRLSSNYWIRGITLFFLLGWQTIKEKMIKTRFLICRKSWLLVHRWKISGFSQHLFSLAKFFDYNWMRFLQNWRGSSAPNFPHSYTDCGFDFPMKSEQREQRKKKLLLEIAGMFANYHVNKGTVVHTVTDGGLMRKQGIARNSSTPDVKGTQTTLKVTRNVKIIVETRKVSFKHWDERYLKLRLVSHAHWLLSEDAGLGCISVNCALRSGIFRNHICSSLTLLFMMTGK